MTNFERIKQMSYDELIDFVPIDVICDETTYSACHRFDNCKQCKRAWLNKEYIGERK